MRGPIALAGFCLFTAAAAAAAARPLVFTAPRSGQTLQGGSLVEVSWTGVPAGAGEVELLLSLDGGNRVAVRLTEELSSGERSFLWRVPNLRARRAALVLRMGIEGREIESAPSAVFEIAPESQRPAAPVDWRSGELWLEGEGRVPDADLLPAAGLDSRSGQWTPLRGEADSISVPAGASLAGAPASERRAAIRAESSVNAPRRGPASRSPLTPLRV